MSIEMPTVRRVRTRAFIPIPNPDPGKAGSAYPAPPAMKNRGRTAEDSKAANARKSAFDNGAR